MLVLALADPLDPFGPDRAVPTYRRHSVPFMTAHPEENPETAPGHGHDHHRAPGPASISPTRARPASRQPGAAAIPTTVSFASTRAAMITSTTLDDDLNEWRGRARAAHHRAGRDRTRGGDPVHRDGRVSSRGPRRTGLTGRHRARRQPVNRGRCPPPVLRGDQAPGPLGRGRPPPPLPSGQRVRQPSARRLDGVPPAGQARHRTKRGH